MIKHIKYLYWNLPFLTDVQKENFFYKLREIVRGKASIDKKNKTYILEAYRDQIHRIPSARSKNSFVGITKKKYVRENNDIKLFAFYLPQFYPTRENDEWWGKGTTEWNNVCRAVPQFIGHYQPRQPGELGFYDLRLVENIERQVELAKMYGIFGFCFYYYWFDGKRLLDKPLDTFIANHEIDFPFCLCWCNESWTSAFVSGGASTVIMKQNDTEESYKKFIEDYSTYLKDDRYYSINGKKVLMIYKVQDIPNKRRVIEYWREYCLNNGIGELYIIGCWRPGEKYDALEFGFDALFEFQASSIMKYCKLVNDRIDFVDSDFTGRIYSYKDVVEEEIYKRNYTYQKLYHAIFPMWDNTPRRNNHDGIIFHESTPLLYKKWLKELIKDNNERRDLDDNLGFINSWNEWGEGSYIEPDKYYGYAYLNATREAIEESRE